MIINYDSVNHSALLSSYEFSQDLWTSSESTGFLPRRSAAQVATAQKKPLLLLPHNAGEGLLESALGLQYVFPYYFPGSKCSKSRRHPLV